MSGCNQIEVAGGCLVQCDVAESRVTAQCQIAADVQHRAVFGADDDRGGSRQDGRRLNVGVAAENHFAAARHLRQCRGKGSVCPLGFAGAVHIDGARLRCLRFLLRIGSAVQHGFIAIVDKQRRHLLECSGTDRCAAAQIDCETICSAECACIVAGGKRACHGSIADDDSGIAAERSHIVAAVYGTPGAAAYREVCIIIDDSITGTAEQRKICKVPDLRGRDAFADSQRITLRVNVAAKRGCCIAQINVAEFHCAC